ncbi:MAG TPA: PKD domain-containing protein [Pyrinomonadaceae bacterium]|nr:PKD domain-containing protein [Pyrinomonadaceae bacterium]
MTRNVRQPRARRRFAGAALALLLLAAGVAPLAFAQSGSIHPLAIEIDKSANLYPGDSSANILNPGATADWVKDSFANTDTDPDPNDPVAVGIVPNVSGAPGGTGHWNGVRIIDGIAQGDQDIFLTGGKENDTSTWNVGPGSVGSSKYDITQAYIANNQSFIYFGMERRGNNGTTAFDFEFNQSGTAGGYIPHRTVGDVLLTFEMQGSGNTGSATPHVFRWDGSSYVEQNLSSLPAGLVTSINNVDTKPAPWGYVDSKGNWVLSPDIPRFEFAEAQVPLSILPNVNPCGGFAYVQVRTRSSSTATSDLKDTTKIFRYVFGGPSAVAHVAPSCTLALSYSASGSADSTGNTTSPSLTYAWTFQRQNPDGSWSNVGTASGASGTFNAPSPGHYRALLTVTETAGCSDSTASNEIDVSPLFATASKTLADGSALAVTLSGSAPSGADLQWQRLSGASWVDIAGAKSLTLTYSSFEADTAPTVPYSFSIGSDSYAGKLWAVQLRLHASRTVGTQLCAADSPAVTVKKVTGVDP